MIVKRELHCYRTVQSQLDLVGSAAYHIYKLILTVANFPQSKFVHLQRRSQPSIRISRPRLQLRMRLFKPHRPRQRFISMPRSMLPQLKLPVQTLGLILKRSW
ncbi:hypothetical protein DPMN_084363 [Dreissena polymorpha]|uniref:Uncharacterized protein n=1 Tax=Dreissena polymorpha TaxID=45954 RepID=A0A9D3YAE6_DREPO|nr:hypothetical protein DPMN_084363 [Dreissena polymorpha]